MARKPVIRKREKPREITDERLMITGMVVSDLVLRSLRPNWRPDLCVSGATRLVADWCCDYWDRYGEAPKHNIESIYRAAMEKDLIPEDDASIVEKLLDSCSKEYSRADKFNAQYALDRGLAHIKAQGLDALFQRAQGLVKMGDVLQAEAELARYRKPDIPVVESTNPWTDKDAIREAFTTVSEPLFTLPGAAGQMLNDHLIREGFLLWQGPMKRGKTWTLQELAFRAGAAGNNVVFFGAGDMSRAQMILRHHIRLEGRSNLAKYCQPGLMPVLDCRHNQEDACKLRHRVNSVGAVRTDDEGADSYGLIPFSEAPAQYRPCVECWKSKKHRAKWQGAHWWEETKRVNPLDWRDAIVAGAKFNKLRSRGNAYEIACYPNSTLTVQDIEATLDLWEADGRMMDVVVVDYADILKPEPGTERMEKRHQINETFKALRRLAQERRILLITASQSDSGALESRSQRPHNFSESVMKYAHVTATIALNQTPDEKNMGIMRWGLLNAREGEFDILSEVHILQRIQMGRPLLGSYL